MIEELVIKNRSYRRFYNDKKVSEDILKNLVRIGHLAPSAANRQALRYKLVCQDEMNDAVFSCVGWAGYFKDWDGPVPSERPSAYIIMVAKKGENCAHDEGISGQTILLAAVEAGLGGCFIGNIKKAELSRKIGLGDDLEIKLVIALGYPKEEVVLETIHEGEDIRYYRDEDQIHHVPKIAIEDVLL